MKKLCSSPFASPPAPLPSGAATPASPGCGRTRMFCGLSAVRPNDSLPRDVNCVDGSEAGGEAGQTAMGVEDAMDSSVP